LIIFELGRRLAGVAECSGLPRCLCGWAKATRGVWWCGFGQPAGSAADRAGGTGGKMDAGSRRRWRHGMDEAENRRWQSGWSGEPAAAAARGRSGWGAVERLASTWWRRAGDWGQRERERRLREARGSGAWEMAPTLGRGPRVGWAVPELKFEKFSKFGNTVVFSRVKFEIRIFGRKSPSTDFVPVFAELDFIPSRKYGIQSVKSEYSIGRYGIFEMSGVAWPHKWVSG